MRKILIIQWFTDNVQITIETAILRASSFMSIWNQSARLHCPFVAIDLLKKNNGDLAISMIICKETHGNFGAIILAIKENLHEISINLKGL